MWHTLFCIVKQLDFIDSTPVCIVMILNWPLQGTEPTYFLETVHIYLQTFNKLIPSPR
jgi:hypothetical protein